MNVDESTMQTNRGEQPMVELQLEGADSAAQAEPVYMCTVCRQTFGAADVYDADGAIICTACWDRANRPAAGQSIPSPTPPPRPKPPPRPALLGRLNCPHCAEPFAPQDVFWLASHPELVGDPIVGPDAPIRFLPTQFTIEGAARDARGAACRLLACPHCHLLIPRPLLESESLVISIVGAPGSGKSYFLTAMTWELRRILPLYFGVSFADAEPAFNHALNEQEGALFLPGDSDRPVKLDKTEAAGQRFHDTVRLDGGDVSLPRPYLFAMRLSGKHPNADYAPHLARVVGMYDNAGEHFEPADRVADYSLTRHLGLARAILFLFDPTQDAGFVRQLRTVGVEPQLNQPAARDQQGILIETADRIRQLAGLSAQQPLNRPLIVVVPKADVWGKLVNLDLSREPIVDGAVARTGLAGVDLDRVEGVSAIVREMLLSIAPRFVAAAEALSANVVYIPITALGHPPHPIGGRDGLWVRPGEIKPQWATVPFLYMFARWTHDIIARVRWEKTP